LVTGFHLRLLLSRFLRASSAFLLLNILLSDGGGGGGGGKRGPSDNDGTQKKNPTLTESSTTGDGNRAVVNIFGGNVGESKKITKQKEQQRNR